MQTATVIFCAFIAICAIWAGFEVYMENKRFWEKEEEKQREADRKWWTKDVKEYEDWINQN